MKSSCRSENKSNTLAIEYILKEKEVKTNENIRKSLLSLASLASSIMDKKDKENYINGNKSISNVSKSNVWDSLYNQIDLLTESSINIKRNTKSRLFDSFK